MIWLVVFAALAAPAGVVEVRRQADEPWVRVERRSGGAVEIVVDIGDGGAPELRVDKRRRITEYDGVVWFGTCTPDDRLMAFDRVRLDAIDDDALAASPDDVDAWLERVRESAFAVDLIRAPDGFLTIRVDFDRDGIVDAEVLTPWPVPFDDREPCRVDRTRWLSPSDERPPLPHAHRPRP